MEHFKVSPTIKNSTTTVYEDFEMRFVRVYTLMDGRKVDAPCLYAMYEQAFEDIQNFFFVPDESLDTVSYVTIEKRFYPLRFIKTSEDEEDCSTLCHPDGF